VQDLLGEVLVARQPILDANLEVVAYELLFRDLDGSAPQDEAAGVRATATVVVDGLLALGREILTDGEDAFINVPETLLRAGTLLDLPTRGLVLELVEDVADSPEVREAIATHRAAGFRVALDDLAPGDPREGLVDVVDLVKVDVLATGPDVALRFIRELSHRGIAIVAEKVEDPQMFDRVVGAGAELVQGFFFTRPRAVRAVRPLGLTPSHLSLLRAVAADEVDLDEVEQLIRSDLTMTDRFLRLVDVAAGWREVESIRHGLVLLGQRRIHRWVSLLVLSSVTADRSPELVTTASVRARYCEELEARRGGRRQLEAFALGMFSVLGADGVVPAAVLDEVPLTEEARDALLGLPGGLRDLIDVTLAAERADWDELVAIGRAIGLDPRELALAHVEALRWSKQVSQAA
jgi:EAL and modified HD-GYP domain-containing signal transduction protein